MANFVVVIKKKPNRLPAPNQLICMCNAQVSLFPYSISIAERERERNVPERVFPANRRNAICRRPLFHLVPSKRADDSSFVERPQRQQKVINFFAASPGSSAAGRRPSGSRRPLATEGKLFAAVAGAQESSTWERLRDAGEHRAQPPAILLLDELRSLRHRMIWFRAGRPMDF